MTSQYLASLHTRNDGSGNAQFGTITPADAAALKAMGDGNNVPCHVFTTDGNVPHLPSPSDHFPDIQTNTVGFPVSIGTFNAQQQSDIHAYWEFNRATDWTFPAYELPFTRGIPGTFQAGQVDALNSVVPGSGLAGIKNNPVGFGDDPDNPRDPDRFLDTDPAHKKQAECAFALSRAGWPTRSSSMCLSVCSRLNPA